jgi:predicted DNA-binding WGR domain protein
MAVLTRIDPARNINRLYVVQVMPSLFGDWTVLREWGRRGSPGTVRLSSYQRRNEAEAAEQRTITRRLAAGLYGYLSECGPAMGCAAQLASLCLHALSCLHEIRQACHEASPIHISRTFRWPNGR